MLYLPAGPSNISMGSLLFVWDWNTGYSVLELQDRDDSGRHAHSFQFLSEDLIVTASSHELYDLISILKPPSLDVFRIQGRESQKICSLSFPRWKYDMARDGRLHMYQMTMLSSPSSPVSATGFDHEVPFKLDRVQVLLEFCMGIVFEHSHSTRKFEGMRFVIPIRSIMHALPQVFPDSPDSFLGTEILQWDDWSRDGIGLLPFVGYGPSVHRAIGHHGTRIHAWQTEDDDRSRGTHVIFDYSPYSVKRESIGLKESRPAVQVDVLKPDTSRMALFFKQTSHVVLPCVRTRSEKATSLPFIFHNMYVDEEHIVFVKRKVFPQFP